MISAETETWQKQQRLRQQTQARSSQVTGSRGNRNLLTLRGRHARAYLLRQNELYADFLQPYGAALQCAVGIHRDVGRRVQAAARHGRNTRHEWRVSV